MNERIATPLPPDISEALRAERARPDVDAATRARLRAQLQASLLSGGSGGHGFDPERASFASPDALVASTGPSVARRMHPLLTAALGFAAGLATGVAMYAYVASHSPAARIENNLGKPPAVTQTVAPSVRPVAAIDTSAREVRAPQDPAVSVPSASTLTAERVLLDVAHSALGNGAAADALVALSRHEQRFPHGIYREEREALTIQCLRALGRSEEAARRVTAFKTRYPNSLFLSTLEDDQRNNP